MRVVMQIERIMRSSNAYWPREYNLLTVFLFISFKLNTGWRMEMEESWRHRCKHTRQYNSSCSKWNKKPEFISVYLLNKSVGRVILVNTDFFMSALYFVRFSFNTKQYMHFPGRRRRRRRRSCCLDVLQLNRIIMNHYLLFGETTHDSKQRWRMSTAPTT